ncbi:MAG: AAA family ATPase [Methanothrix sp.]|jgi:MoxR-like ATPase|uniref:ATPase n=1 Tax=Methanothrix harundinacea TaxID=301375 RepID=A0A101FVZ3_9EURY|nr:MAG: ATPase [Methanosaeta sp. SDB]KUK45496.1 MAG: ATPase [Methanothrix harundinacea]MDD3708849.1 AAA family ATPase [Methanothrix sp.]MDI9399318.1 AAA family ATPase [Euryarchaeota archaeon]KUK97051.1 MAG: ATPase [Methanothrix harundinacea]
MPDPLRKIDDLVSALEELRLHVGPADLQVGERKVNGQLYIPLANACLRNRAALLYGGMGANKTTLVNLLGSAFLGLSFDEVENRMVTGHPEQTEEKIVGFIDPRQWSSSPAPSHRSSKSSISSLSSSSFSSFDEEVEAIEVLWTPWARSRWKVINEINRFPSGKQNLFLELLQKRKVSYAGETLDLGDTCYFATMNPDFSATYPLDEALLDRISISVPATQPDFLASLALAEREKEVYELAESLPRLSSKEFDSLPGMVAAVSLDSRVELSIISLLRDFTLCERAPAFDKTQLSGGSKPSRGLCAGCHYFNNPEVCCWQVDEGLSDRVRQDLRSYTRALSLLLGLGGSGELIEVLRAVAPYVIWHRLSPNRTMLERPPYYRAGRLQYIKDLVEKSINRTLNERGEMNMIFARAVDGEISPREAIEELSGYDDPIARLDYARALERMV